MRRLRTFLSALALLAAGVVLVSWLLASVAHRSLEDGSVAKSAVTAGLQSPAVTALIADAAGAALNTAVGQSGLDLETLGLTDEFDTLVAGLTSAGSVRDLVTAAADQSREQLLEQIKDADRPAAPFVVSIEIGDAVNAQLDQTPGLGEVVSSVKVPPIEVQVASAEAFDSARTAYQRLDLVKKWGLWVAGGFVALSLLVSTRRAFVISKFAFTATVMFLLVALLLSIAGPLITAGGMLASQGEWTQVVGDVVAERVQADVTITLLTWAGVSLLVGGVALLIGRTVAARKG